MIKVLIAAQTPPPYGGMPIMIQRLLESDLAGVRMVHVRLAFSADANEIGRYSVAKILRLFTVVARIIYRRAVDGPRILYYVPAGPDRMPMIRDMFVLILTRWMFDKTIFHFHLAGISELYERIPGWQKWLFRRAYFGADASIQLSEFNPDDGRRLEAKRHFVVANGIDDPCLEPAGVRAPAAVTSENPLRILFVAILYESKGLMVLVDACKKLAERGVPFQLEVMGNWQSEEYAARVQQRIEELGLGDRIRFLGRVIGDEKFASYRRADVFCFPTFFHCEALPVVLLEATACGLPVVATRWRGIPSIVDDGETGFLVETHDPDAVADRLARLALSPELRERMGAAGRKKFVREFTVSRHLEAMRSVFLEVGGAEPAMVRKTSGALAAI